MGQSEDLKKNSEQLDTTLSNMRLPSPSIKIEDYYMDDDLVAERIVMSSGDVDQVSAKSIVSGMTESFPLRDKIKDMKKQVKNAVKQLQILAKDLAKEIIQTILAIAAGISSLASAIALMPPGSGLPVAFSAIQGMVSNVMALQAKLMLFIPLLGPLSFIALLIPIAMMDVVLTPINVILLTILAIVETIDKFTSMIPSGASASAAPPVYIPPPSGTTGG